MIQQEAQVRSRSVAGGGWRSLVGQAAAAEAALLLLAAVALGDVEAGAFVVAFALTLLLLRRRPRAGAIVATLLFANVGFWMTAAAVSATRSGGRVGSGLLLPAALSAVALVGLVGAVGALRDRPGGRPALAWAAGALVLAGFAGAGLLGRVVGTGCGAGRGADVRGRGVLADRAARPGG